MSPESGAHERLLANAQALNRELWDQLEQLVGGARGRSLLTFEVRAHSREQAQRLLVALRNEAGYDLRVEPDPLLEEPGDEFRR